MLRRCLLVALPVLAIQAAEVREEILVVVNNHIITRRSFQQAVEQESAALYRQFSGKELDEKLRDMREKTLQGLIDSFVIDDKAQDLEIKITDDYLRNVVEDIKKQNNFNSDADFEQALRASAGIGLDDYLKQIKHQMIQQEVLRRDVFSKMAVEEQEMKAYYEEHKDEYRLPSRFRIRELVLSKGTTPEEQQTYQTRLQEVQTGIQAGKSFEELVKTYSTSPSRDTGGDLGWLSKGMLQPSIENASLALKPNQVSAPIQSDKDTTWIQLMEAESEVTTPFADVKDKIREKLQEPKSQSAIEAYLNGLRVRANIRYMIPKNQILKG
jgi:peptidyl-prolyl cis-trans isomerase SurA